MKSMFFMFFLLLSFILSCQEKINTKQIKVKYSYNIEQVESEEQLISATKEIKTLKYVDEVKYIYKPDMRRALIVIYTTQKVRQSEADDEFNITNIKNIVLKHKMLPYDFTEKIID
ncbi:MAG: hypothetical protein N3A01_04790 [Bacteroidales bacterium]|nr:hypothetical protein [Bacteroidales bacterium]